MAFTLRQKVKRLDYIDAIRGVSVWLMIAYHFCYDLVFFKLAHFNLTQDSFWITFRAIIVGLFLLIVGISLHFSLRVKKDWKSYYKRLVILGFAAALITLSSYALFGSRFIYLGILHFITIASILALFFLQFDRLNLVIGLIMIALGFTFQHAFFNQPQFHWLGMMTFKPPTEDFVPIFPWFGFVLIGLFVSKYLPIATRSNWKAHSFFKRSLVFSGQYSLLIYLIHQPILMSLFYGFLFLYR